MVRDERRGARVDRVIATGKRTGCNPTLLLDDDDAAATPLLDLDSPLILAPSRFLVASLLFLVLFVASLASS